MFVIHRNLYRYRWRNNFADDNVRLARTYTKGRTSDRNTRHPAAYVRGCSQLPEIPLNRRALVSKLSQIYNRRARAIQLNIPTKQRARTLRIVLGGTRYNASIATPIHNSRKNRSYSYQWPSQSNAPCLNEALPPQNPFSYSPTLTLFNPQDVRRALCPLTNVDNQNRQES